MSYGLTYRDMIFAASLLVVVPASIAVLVTWMVMR